MTLKNLLKIALFGLIVVNIFFLLEKKGYGYLGFIEFVKSGLAF